MNVGEIRDGLQARLQTVSGLRCYDTAPDKPEFPAAVILTGGDPFIDYLQAFAGGLVTLSFEIRLLVSKTIARRWQDQLDAYLSAGTGAPESVFDAIVEDRTLGLGAGSRVVATPRTAGKYGETTVGPDEVPAGTATVFVTVDVPRTVG